MEASATLPHASLSALVLPLAQKYPAVQSPEHAVVWSPSEAPYLKE